MIKERIIFFSLLIVVVAVLTNCGRSGELDPNSAPVIQITSYGGVDTLDASIDTTIFQQEIYWEAHDTDGWVEAYAYRILDEDGNPISTPGKEYIDFNEGWVLHYESGANESIPLYHPKAKSTIWTDEVYTICNFPAYGKQLIDPETNEAVLDSTGNNIYEPVVSIFEIKCIDDRGEESEILRKYFKSSSAVPNVLSIATSVGPIDGKVIGTGVRFQFRISDTDPLIGNEPSHFLYRLEKRNLNGNLIYGENGYFPDYWFTTQGQQDVTEVLLNPTSYPALKPNTVDPFDEDTFLDSTYLIVVAYDLAGIPSFPDTIAFAVKDGFYPGTMIYCGFNPNKSDTWDGLDYKYNDIFAIGDYHYSIRKNEFISDIDVPEEVTENEIHYGLPFWIDKDGNFTAISENIPDQEDLKIYMHWGYQGEYGTIGQSTNTVTNSPYNQRIGELRDENTGKLYYSELSYFDLQLDGEPYHYPPLVGQVETVMVEPYGYFTRVPVGADIDQRTILHGLEPGEHIFRVRAVDLSNIGDPTPAEFRFTIVEPVLKEEKSGILIIDEDKNDLIFSPDEILDSLYIEALSDYSGIIDTYDLWDNSISTQEIASYNSVLHFSNDQLSPVDMQNYQLVIYHNDKPNASSKFHRNNNCFKIFFQLGGNLLASLGDNAYHIYNNCNLNAYKLLEDNFGITYKRDPVNDQDMLSKVSGSFLSNPFMIGADPVYPIETPLEVELDSTGVFINLINIGQGLGPVTCFSEDAFEEQVPPPDFLTEDFTLPVPIYRYICKADTATVFPPSTEEYNEYNNQVIAIKHSTEREEEIVNTNYMFGFALPLMDIQEVKALFNEILTDLGMLP